MCYNKKSEKKWFSQSIRYEYWNKRWKRIFHLRILFLVNGETVSALVQQFLQEFAILTSVRCRLSLEWQMRKTGRRGMNRTPESGIGSWESVPSLWHFHSLEMKSAWKCWRMFSKLLFAIVLMDTHWKVFLWNAHFLSFCTFKTIL